MKALAAVAIAVCSCLSLAVGMVIGAVGTPSSALGWEDPEIGIAVYYGAATERHLWLAGSNGRVVRFDRDTGERHVVAEQVDDILADGPHLWALSRPGGLTFEIRDLNDASLPVRTGEVSGGYPRLIGMTDGAGVLAEEALFTPSGESLARHPLTHPWRGWTLTAVSASGAIYAGMNLGEFGGRLARIDPRSGAIREITRVGADDEPCTADFDPSCDPIVGILPDPSRPDCVIAASGQEHLGFTSGRIYRVCGDALTLTYETPDRTPLWVRLLHPSYRRLHLTAPIRSLVATSDGWVAVSQGRYFRMRNGQVREHPLPDLHPWSGLFISEEQDGVLFVMAGCCAGPPFNAQSWIVAIPVLD